ncbi:hypothetical protein OIU76_023326 [Salix suchowensis]|nr:hypothetical protein OIU76_023326 [Salix suchowensis]
MIHLCLKSLTCTRLTGPKYEATARSWTQKYAMG